MTDITVDQVIEKYVVIREIKRDLERDHEEALKPISEKLEKLGAWLLGKMQETGVDSFKTKNGTAYKSNKTSCTIADREMFKSFVFAPLAGWLKASYGVEVEPQVLMSLARLDLVDFRSLKEGVEMFIEDHSQVPPGLTVAQTTTVNVRRK